LLRLTNRPLPEIESRTSSSVSPVILWLRQDLRLHDNPALVLAAASRRPVIPVYMHVPAEEGTWPLGGAAQYWLNHALLHLSQALESKLGSKLLILSGESSLDLLLQLIVESGATAVCFNRVYEPWKISRDALIAEVLSENGVTVCSNKGVVLFEPLEVIPDTDERLMYGFGSVGFFLNACDGHDIEEPLPPPNKALRAPKHWPLAMRVEQLGLDVLPLRPDGTEIDWAAGIREFWGFGEDAALAGM
jgi:deoxyribodipyrimidine photo-lyase